MNIHATYEETTLNKNKVSMIIPRGAMIVLYEWNKIQRQDSDVTIEKL